MKKKIFLIDANSYLYRAYYAVSPLADVRGKATSAIYGFTRMLLRLMKTHNPDYVAVAFDLPTPALRRKKFVEYYAKRPKMPPDLKGQIPYIKEILAGLRVPVFEIDGYDADDVLATIAKRLRSSGLDIYVVTSFKDALALADDVKVINPHQRAMTYDGQAVKKRYGIEPAMIPDFLSLCGDESENIPGVPGVGEKRAAALLSKYKSLRNVVKNADNLAGKMRENLRASKRDLNLWKKIATLDADVPVKFELTELERKSPDARKLAGIFRRLEFTSLLSQISKHAHPPGAEYTCVLSEDSLETLVRELQGVAEFSIDTETTGLDPMTSELVGISLSIAPGRAWYIPLAHCCEGASAQLEKRFVLGRLRPILEDPNRRKIGHNVKFDMRALLKEGVGLNGVSFDTMVASYLLNPVKGRHSLETLALEHLNYKMISFKELLGSLKNFACVDLSRATEYSCEDADITLQLKPILLERLKGRSLMGHFEELEISLLGLLCEIEHNGIAVSAAGLDKLIDESNKGMISRIKKHINPKTGRIHPVFSQTHGISGRLSSRPDFSFLFDRREHPERLGGVFLAEEGNAHVFFSYVELEPKIESFIRGGQPASPAGRDEAFFRRNLLARARKDEFVSTIFGRSRRIPEINSPNRNLRLLAEKEALEFVIQASASDIIKRSLAKIGGRIKRENLPFKIILQAGDGILFEISRQQTERSCGIIKEEMGKALPEGLSLEVEAH